MFILGQTPTLDTDAYSAGDAVGGLLTFNAGAIGSRTMILKRAELMDDAASPDSADMDLHLFSLSSMAVADDAAFSVSAANFLAGNYLGKINFSSYSATVVGTNAAGVLSIQDNLDRLIPFQRGRVYGQLVCNGTPTFLATQLTVLLHFAEYA